MHGRTAYCDSACRAKTRSALRTAWVYGPKPEKLSDAGFVMCRSACIRLLWAERRDKANRGRCVGCGTFGLDPRQAWEREHSVSTKPGPGACIDWTRRNSEKGYGFTRAGKSAHRTAWAVVHGPIPEGMVIMHLCDRPPCVNVDHLRCGTQTENIRDAAAKGRLRPGKNKRKLTRALAAEIRASHESGAACARRLGIHESTVSKVRRGRLWRLKP